MLATPQDVCASRWSSPLELETSTCDEANSVCGEDVKARWVVERVAGHLFGGLMEQVGGGDIRLHACVDDIMRQVSQNDFDAVLRRTIIEEVRLADATV
jgi:hypothetical protein